MACSGATLAALRTVTSRMLIEADVMALIRGEGGIADRVRFVLDVPKDAKGKVPKLKNAVGNAAFAPNQRHHIRFYQHSLKRSLCAGCAQGCEGQSAQIEKTAVVPIW